MDIIDLLDSGHFGPIHASVVGVERGDAGAIGGVEQIWVLDDTGDHTR